LLESVLANKNGTFRCCRYFGGPRRNIPRTWNALIKCLLKMVPGTEFGTPTQPAAS
jgi:hypothetical protein